MKFHIFAEMEYTAFSAGTLILNIHSLQTHYQRVVSETFSIEPYINFEELHSTEGENRLIRLEIDQASTIKVSYAAKVDTSYQIKNYAELQETPVARMNAAVFPYLYPSRYCQSDKLYRLAN